ncbi:hypothetical protein DFH09DRAFT_1132052, partial [Mycena vulgaris]
MDQVPVRGETIPIRLFLGGFDLTRTFRDINKKFSTHYYLNLVLIDKESRRYFKQQPSVSPCRRSRLSGYRRINSCRPFSFSPSPRFTCIVRGFFSKL